MKKCDLCASETGRAELGEIPGMYMDFDSDQDFGGKCIPLCPRCLGSGMRRNDKKFLVLSSEAEKLRQEALDLLMRARREVNGRQYDYRVGAINTRLIDIALEACNGLEADLSGTYAGKLLKKQ